MLEKLKSIICEYVDVEPEKIIAEAKFIEDLHFNSYDFMSFLGEVEETFNVMVDEHDVLELQTVEDAIAYIEKLMND